MKIEIFKPFGEAFELTKKILFQPFDLAKWCVIGFAAFLAGNFGGLSFNPVGNFRGSHTTHRMGTPQFLHWAPWVPVAIAAAVLFFLCLILVLAWLTARGRFIFTDCIVRNRGAIVAPWHQYRREGNSYFLFSLAVMFFSGIFLAFVGLILFLTGIFSAGSHQRNPVLIAIVIVFFVIAWIALALFIGLTSYFMVPVMYRQRCLALEAFRTVLALLAGNVLPFVLFCLFIIVLVMAVVLIETIATCLTCCLAALPYVGTVLLLPVFVCLRSFGLLFLRQFGPEYDVWAISPQPEPPPIPTAPSV